MNNPFQLSEFVGVALGEGVIRGVLARRRGKKLELRRMVRREFAADQLAEALKAVFDELSPGRETVILIAATLPGDSCFGCELPELKGEQLRSALEFELPRRLPAIPPDYRLEYSSQPGRDGLRRYVVQVFPGAAAEPLLAALSAVGRGVDELAHPLLLLPELPVGAATRFPEMSGPFCWQDGVFQYPAADRSKVNQALSEVLGARFLLKEGEREAVLKEYLTPLTAVLFAAAPGFRRRRAGLGFLPPEFRPRRYRRMGYLAVLLGVLLVGCLALRGCDRVRSFRSEYLRLRDRAEELAERSAKLKRQLAVRDTEWKELKRVLELSPGDHQLLNKLAVLSEKLPKEAQLTSFRMAEGNFDLTLQTSQSNLDATTALRREGGFKINRLQQRRMNDSVTVITMQLTAEPAAEVQP